ncbi:MAG: FGGY-family carbohydrate kinase [Planctomycetota bacterium]|nr:FGGY-family carbohydrate kinase [Planctomycetota bacterium]
MGSLPNQGRACFIMDLFAARLAGGAMAIEPSAAGSSGLFRPQTRAWDDVGIAALGFDRSWFPPVGEASQPMGKIAPQWAREFGLSEQLSIFPPLGDHQSSFLGSVANRSNDVLVNVGTGAQVAVFTDGLDFAPPVELRPFPFSGNLLSNVGLPGGWSYQLLEQFFAQVGRDVLSVPVNESLYPAINRLAREAPAGAGGLRCEPTFAGTRSNAAVRGTFSGISPQNFTPAHFARALLEGMAAALYAGFQTIQKQHPTFHATRLVAAGNGLRENLLLAELVAESFGLPMVNTVYCEEAAVGAALAAAVGEGVFSDLDTAGMSLRYA